MGLSEIAPPSASVPGVHSRWLRCSKELPPSLSPRGPARRRGVTFDPDLPSSGFVPSLSFLPTSTACSTWYFSGLLHPETDLGVRQVSGSSGLVRSSTGRPRALAFGRPHPGRAALAGFSPVASSRPVRPRRGQWLWRGDQSRTGIRRTIPCGASPFEAFPSSSAVSRQSLPLNRTPRVRFSSGNPSLRGRPKRNRSLETGHRDPCLLVVVPVPGPARSCFPHAGCVVQADRSRSLDLKALSRR